MSFFTIIVQVHTVSSKLLIPSKHILECDPVSLCHLVTSVRGLHNDGLCALWDWDWYHSGDVGCGRGQKGERNCELHDSR